MLSHSVLLVDDHPMFRSGLRRLIDQHPRMHVVGEASTAHEALNLASSVRPDLIVIDVRLPGVTGLRLAAAFRTRVSHARLVFLSMTESEDDLLSAAQVGAMAYLTKDIAPDELIKNLYAVLSGENLLVKRVLGDPVLARRVLEQLRSGKRAPSLSVQELAVLDCLVLGYSNKQIGEALFITEQTVKNHMTFVLRKLAVEDRVRALRWAVQQGWAEIGAYPVETVAA